MPALLENELDNVEVLFVDDGSTDATIPAVERILSRKAVDFRLLRLSRRRGPAEARNAGMREARHRYLLFVDADVVLPPQTVCWIRESLHLYSHRSEVAGVLGLYSEEIPWQDFLSNFKNLYTCFLYRVTRTVSPYLHTSIFCVRRDVLEQAGGFESGLERGEDFQLGVRLGSRGFRFVIDWRIQGVHRKKYTLGGVFEEDWKRIRSLSRMRLAGQEKSFAFRAHRLSRLAALPVSGASLLSALLAFWLPQLGITAALLMMAFLVLNASFLRFVRKRRGWLFTLQSAAFLFLEMLWAQVALVVFWTGSVMGWRPGGYGSSAQ